MEQSVAVSGAKAGWQPSVKIRTDEALIVLIAAHDRSAMRDLFVRHSARVYRFLFRAINDAAAAEDLLNDVFVDVWRNAGQFEGRAKVSTWILAIAHFKLEDGAVEAIKDLADDPEVAAQKQNFGVVIRECLKRLSPAHRTILDLIYYHEQSIAEVARIVGIPENTVKTRAYYARKCLEQLLAERGIDHEAL
jgi:RNA polymerase sigma-70 factor, ECF subfamily